MHQHRKINKSIILYLIIIIVFTLQTIYALTNPLSSLLKKTERPLISYLPIYSEIDWLTIIYENKVEKQRILSKIYKTYNSLTNCFEEKSISKIGETKTVYDENLRLLEYTSKYKDDEIIQKIGYDTLITLYDTSKSELKTNTFSNAKMKDEKKIFYDEYSITTSNVNIFIQGMIATGFNKSFNADFVVIDQSIKINMDFNYFHGKNIQSLMPQYNLPEELLKLLIMNNNEYIVYTLELTGFAKLIYPHKTFILYMDEYPFEVYGVISGAPENAVYSFQNVMKVK